MSAAIRPNRSSRTPPLLAGRQTLPAFTRRKAFAKAALTASFVAILAVACPGTASAEPVRAPSLCLVPETVLFSCQVGPKVVSVCGQGPGQAAYRYGRPGRVELELTELWSADHAFSGGGETQVYARTPTNLYIVYDRTVRTSFADGRNEPAEEAGVVVQAGGKTIMAQRCKQPVIFDPVLQRSIPGGDYVPH